MKKAEIQLATYTGLLVKRHHKARMVAEHEASLRSIVDPQHVTAGHVVQTLKDGHPVHAKEVSIVDIDNGMDTHADRREPHRCLDCQQPVLFLRSVGLSLVLDTAIKQMLRRHPCTYP